jgi:hypothetical protein
MGNAHRAGEGDNEGGNKEDVQGQSACAAHGSGVECDVDLRGIEDLATALFRDEAGSMVSPLPARKHSKTEPTEEDVLWAEDRVIALMHKGMPFVMAAQFAAAECTERVLRRQEERDRAFDLAVREERERRRVDREKVQADERQKRRAEIDAKATPAQRPTLCASLGDLLKAKGRP